MTAPKSAMADKVQKVCPRELTDEMLTRGSDAFLERSDNRFAVFADDICAVWQAVYDAAPTPAEPMVDGEYAELITALRKGILYRDDYAVRVTRTECVMDDAADAIASLVRRVAEQSKALIEARAELATARLDVWRLDKLQAWIDACRVDCIWPTNYHFPDGQSVRETLDTIVALSPTGTISS